MVFTRVQNLNKKVRNGKQVTPPCHLIFLFLIGWVDCAIELGDWFGLLDKEGSNGKEKKGGRATLRRLFEKVVPSGLGNWTSGTLKLLLNYFSTKKATANTLLVEKKCKEERRGVEEDYFRYRLPRLTRIGGTYQRRLGFVIINLSFDHSVLMCRPKVYVDSN